MNVFPIVLIYIIAIEYFVLAQGGHFKCIFVEKMRDALPDMIFFLFRGEMLHITQ